MSTAAVDLANVQRELDTLRASHAAQSSVSATCEELRQALSTAGLRRESLERDVASLRAAAAQSREDAVAASAQAAQARTALEAARAEKDAADAKAVALAAVRG